MDPVELVRLIAWQATSRHGALTAIRLVKFLYLADLYFARRNGGKTLTGWRWRFVHYGPFCGEALDAIKTATDRGVIAARAYESKFSGEEKQVYSGVDLDREPAVLNTLPTYVTLPLGGAVRTWGDDTAGLLDHVYFHTEPMQHARPDDVLDFSTAREPVREQPVTMTKLPHKKIQKAREALRKLGAAAKPAAPDNEALYDDVFQRGLELLDGSELQGGLVGEARIIASEDE